MPPPVVITEPISLVEAKLFMRIDEDYTYDDTIINLIITANREWLEQELGLSLVPKTGLKYQYKKPCCGQRNKVYLPYGPVSSVSAQYLSDASEYTLVNIGNDPLYPVYLPSASIDITYDAGNWAPFPSGLKLALLMLVATNYENRENFVVGQTVNEVTQNATNMAFKWSRNLYL